VSLVSDEAAIKLTPIGTYRGGMYSEITPTQARYDPETRRVFVGSGDRHTIDVLDISDPTNPHKIYDIDLSPYDGIEPNGLAIHHGVIGVTVKVSPGVENVVFFNVGGKLLAGPIRMDRAVKSSSHPMESRLL